MKTIFRIVSDEYLGYEVQKKRWWFPFWIQINGRYPLVNTSSSLEEANKVIKNHTNRKPGNKQ